MRLVTYNTCDNDYIAAKARSYKIFVIESKQPWDIVISLISYIHMCREKWIMKTKKKNLALLKINISFMNVPPGMYG